MLAKLHKRDDLCGAQAIDRCHRLGQTRDVVVTKLITAHHREGGETVEQRMLGIQVTLSCRQAHVTPQAASMKEKSLSCWWNPCVQVYS